MNKYLFAPRVIMLTIATLFVIGCGDATSVEQDAGLNGTAESLVSVVSPHSVDDTVQRLQDIISDAGFVIPLVIDHRANAANVGKELPPTKLIIFGNPNVGTVLMQNRRTVAIDLPQKFLVWEDANGTVRITYNDPKFIGQRHKVEGLVETLDKVSNALNNFAAAATQ